MSRVEMAMRQRVQELSGEAFSSLPETEFYALVKRFEALSGSTSPNKKFRVVTVRQTSVEIQADSLTVSPAPQARVLPLRERTSGSLPSEVVRSEVVRYEPEPPPLVIDDAPPIFSEEILPRHAELPAEPGLSASVREELLQLRATILLAARNNGLKAVMICGTSSQETEQAELLAAQLSALLAEFGNLKVAFLRVADQEHQPERYHLPAPTKFTFVLRRTHRANLYEVASSRGTVTLQDWLRHHEPEQVVQLLKQKFDLLVVVAPPVTRRYDTALLAGAVDGVILTATESTTSYARIERAQQRLAQASASILGVTLLHSDEVRPLFIRLKQFAGRWLERSAEPRHQLE